MSTARQLVQHLANRAGYRIQKIRPTIENDLDVFGLVVRECMRLRGSDLSFIQIGANDGVRSDPIREYVKRHHWSGVLVEPQPATFERLVANYGDEPQLRFENAAIAEMDGAIKLHRLRDDPALPDWANGVASLKEDEVLSHRRLIPNLADYVEVISVPAVTMATLLAKHGVENIDVLQVDTEGFDFEILKMADLGRWKPAIIQYEHFHMSLDDQVACRRFLSRHGYKMCSVVGDTIACSL